MHDQVAAAQAALAEAERRDDPLLVQAARSHLDGLLDLARRNGVVVEGPTEGAEAAARLAVGEPLQQQPHRAGLLVAAELPRTAGRRVRRRPAG